MLRTGSESLRRKTGNSSQQRRNGSYQEDEVEPLLSESVAVEPLLSDVASSGVLASEKHKPSWTRNIYVMCFFFVTWGLANSIWMGDLLAAYTFLLAKDHPRPNSIVGAVQTAQSTAMMVAAFPVGYLADKFGKVKVIKGGTFGFILALVLVFIALILILRSNEVEEWFTGGNLSKDLNWKWHIVVLTIGLFLVDLFGQVFEGPLQAFYAESVPINERAYYFTLLRLWYRGPSILVKIMTFMFFESYGNQWTIEILSIPLLIGVLLEILPVSSVFFLAASKLPNKDDASNIGIVTSADAIVDKEGDYYDNEADTSGKDIGLHLDESKVFEVKSIGLRLSSYYVPHIILFSDSVYAFGSGLTVGFFPLLFMNVLKLSPATTEIIKIFLVCLMIPSAFIAHSFSLISGRVQIVLLTRIVGVVLLVGLVMLSKVNSTWEVIVIVYLLQQSIMYAAHPISSSLLMDSVTDEARARWKALDSLSVYGWGGSAVIGGMIVDSYGYNIAFLVTALLQMIGCFSYALMLVFFSK